MKKVFNLTVMLAALMTAVVFSSCKNNEEDEVNIKGLKVAYTLGTDDYIIGEITSDATLKKVTLFSVVGATKNEEASWENFKSGEIKENGGKYDIKFEVNEFEPGIYVLKAEDKNAKYKEVQFEIKGVASEYLTSFTAKEGDTYEYEYNGKIEGSFTIAKVTKEAGDKGYEVVFSDGFTATISYTLNSFLTVNGTTKNGTQAADNAGADLLLYIDGKTDVIKAGQLMVFKGADGLVGTADDIANLAKTTRFLKQ